MTSLHSLCTLNSMLPHQRAAAAFDVAKRKSSNDLLKTNATFWSLVLFIYLESLSRAADSEFGKVELYSLRYEVNERLSNVLHVL